MLVLLFLTGPIADLPKAVLGAVIVAACIGLVDPAAWRALWATDRVEFTIAAVTAGRRPRRRRAARRSCSRSALSIVDVVRRSARPHDAVLGWVAGLGRCRRLGHPHARPSDARRRRVPARRPPVLRQRPLRQGPRARGAARRAAPEHALVFDAEGVSHVDTAGVDALVELAASLRRDGIELVVARMKDPVVDRLRAAGVVDAIGADRFYGNVGAAVEDVGPGVS